MSDENACVVSCRSLLEALDADAHRQLAESVSGDFRRWKQARSRLEAKWRECWEAYLCDSKSMYTEPDAAKADFSRIVRPVLYEAVEAIHSNLLNALFPANEQFFTVSGRSESDHRNAKLIEEFLRLKLQESSFIEKYALFLKQAVIVGTSVAAVPWKQLSRVRRVEQPVTLFGVTVGYQKIEQEEWIQNGPDFEVLDMFDFVLDPDAPEFAQAKVIHKVTRNLRDLEINPAYSNLSEVRAGYVAAADVDNGNKRSRRRAFGLDEAVLESNDQVDDKVTLLEAWGDFVVNNVVYRDHVCVVANDKTVIRFEPNPYDSGLRPFVFTTFIPVPNEIYGIGAIEKSLGLQHAINTLTNQKLDVINLSINNPFTYLINDDVFDPETIVTRPGALIPVKSHDTLRPIQYLNNFTVAFTEIADLKNEAQEATGALKYFTGVDNYSSPRTATEVSALVSGGSQKFSSFLSHLEHTSLEPFLRIVYENARQFVTEAENIRLPAPGGKLAFCQVLPEILKTSDCNFMIEGARGLLHRDQELQAISAFLKLVESYPPMKEQVNLLALYKKIYRRLGFRDEAEIFSEQSPESFQPQ